jgi:hypothetical protein
LKTIYTKEEFDELLATYSQLIFYVYSPWSGVSAMGLKLFKSLSEGKPQCTYIVIDNEFANSFIYKWLRDQEQFLGENNPRINKIKGAWINGYGEVFGTENGKLTWFEHLIHTLKLKM